MAQDTPKVSVVIPTYKRAHLLPRAIKCAQAQTYANLEIIIVDDNSLDNTEATVKHFSDSRIKYLKHSRNRGTSAAKNTGITHSTGSYIAFLDDDDMCVDNRIEEQLKYFPASDAVLCGARINNNSPRKIYGKSVVDINDLRKGNIFPGGASILMVKSSLIKNDLFDENLLFGEDWDLLVRFCAKYIVTYTSTPLVLYNAANHSRLTNALIDMPLQELERRLTVFYKHKDFLGPFWFNYRVASRLLSHIRGRSGKINHIAHTIRRCGVIPVVAVLYAKTTSNLYDRLHSHNPRHLDPSAEK